MGELRRAQEIPRGGGVPCGSSPRCRDGRRSLTLTLSGVEPICRAAHRGRPQIAPNTYWVAEKRLPSTQARWMPSWWSRCAGDGTWRTRKDPRPGRIVSVHDPESRHGHKTNHNYRDGFKAHIGIEPHAGLITACELTAGNTGDTSRPHAARRLRLRVRRVPLRSRHPTATWATIKPTPLRPQIDNGFTADDFPVGPRRYGRSYLVRNNRKRPCDKQISPRLNAKPPHYHTTSLATAARLRHRCTCSRQGKILVDPSTTTPARRRPSPRSHTSTAS